MVPKTKIRRRRKKIPLASIPVVGVAKLEAGEASQKATEDVQNPHLNAEHKPKLSEIYVREEKEVKKALTFRMNIKQKKQEYPESPSLSQKLRQELEFFTDCNENDTKFTARDPSDLPDGKCSEVDDKTISEPIDGHQQLASSFVQIDDEPVVQIWKPEKIDVVDAELFLTNQIKETDNLNENIVEARNLEDDGICVHEPPAALAEVDEDFLIRRLLQGKHYDCIRLQKGKHKLFGLKRFTEESFGRFRSVSSKEFVPIFFEPRSEANDANKNVSDKSGMNELHLCVESIKWDNANEVTEEQRLTRLIEDLYDEYRNHNQINTIGQLEQKLKSIRDILQQFEAHPAHDRDISQFIFDRRDLRNKLHREHQSMRDNVVAILEQWVQLKSVRKSQGFVGTPLKLVIRTTDTDMVADQKRWDLDFNAELNEVLEEAIQFYEDSRKRKIRKTSGVELESDSGKPNPEEIEDMLHDIFSRSRRHPGEPIIRLELEEQTCDIGEPNKISLEQCYNIQISIAKQKKMFSKKVASKGNSKVRLNAEALLRVAKDEEEGCHIVVSKTNCFYMIYSSLIRLFFLDN